MKVKGPGIKDYTAALQQKKKEAAEQGMQYLEVSSRQLHAEISPNHATMPTCCQAIYKLLLEGDEILRKPRGQTGFGSRLVVRFNLENMDNRNPMFPAKKRGRPAKTEEEKKISRMFRPNRTTEDLACLIIAWLNERGWETTMRGSKITATKDEAKWIIDVTGSKRGRRQPLSVKLNSVLNDIEDETAHYSVAFNDSSLYRKQWNDVPRILRARLNVSVIFADKHGKVLEFE